MLVHAHKSFLFLKFFFYNCSTFPPQRCSLAYWCAIGFMWAAKIRIYQLIGMPGGASSPTHWATSVHTYPKSNTGGTNSHVFTYQGATHLRGCSRNVNSAFAFCQSIIVWNYLPWWQHFLSCHFTSFHIWLSSIRTLNQPLKSNDATPTVTTKKSTASCHLVRTHTCAQATKTAAHLSFNYCTDFNGYEFSFCAWHALFLSLCGLQVITSRQ